MTTHPGPEMVSLPVRDMVRDITPTARIDGCRGLIPPPDIIEAAEKVSRWARTHGLASWQIAGCYSAPSTHRTGSTVQDFEQHGLHGGATS